MARELFGLTISIERRTLILKLFWFSAFQIKSCTKLILDQNPRGKYKQMRGRKDDLCGRGVRRLGRPPFRVACAGVLFIIKLVSARVLSRTLLSKNKPAKI